MPLFGTPVDASTIAVRADPESPLRLFPTSSGEAQAFVGVPASAPALTAAEAEQLMRFFVRDSGESTWWKTQHPARFALERVSKNLLAGRLLQRGAVVVAGDDPARRPDGDGFYFRVLRRPPRVIRDPCGPRPRPEGAREGVWRTPACETMLATFPCYGSEVVWLRCFRPGKERPPLLARLDSELAVLRELHALAPAAVARPLHDGRLETTRREGRYAAFRQPPGVPVQSLLGGDPQSAEDRRALARSAAAGLAALMRVAHGRRLCLGPLTPSLLRVRHALRDGHAGFATMLTALPAAARPGAILPPGVLELFPLEDAQSLCSQLDEPYRCSVRGDLRALAHLARELMRLCGVEDGELTRAAQRLDRGDAAALREGFLGGAP